MAASKEKSKRSSLTLANAGDLQSVAKDKLVSELAAGLTDPKKQKQCIHRLITVLRDEEVAQLFSEGGFNKLLQVLTGGLTGNSIQYALQAVRSFIMHDFGLDLLLQSARSTKHIYSLVHPSSSILVTRYAVDVLTTLVEDTESGGMIIDKIVNEQSVSKKQDPYSNIVSMLESGDSNVKGSCLKFVNVLLNNAPSAEDYEKLYGYFQAHNFTKLVEALAKETKDPAVLEQVRLFLSRGSDYSQVNKMLRADYRKVQHYLKELTSLYSETKSEVNRLRASLAYFKKREPLVRLLWGEIARARSHLQEAIQAGFTCSLDAPISRISSEPPPEITDLSSLANVQDDYFAEPTGPNAAGSAGGADEKTEEDGSRPASHLRDPSVAPNYAEFRQEFSAATANAGINASAKGGVPLPLSADGSIPADGTIAAPFPAPSPFSSDGSVSAPAPLPAGLAPPPMGLGLAPPPMGLGLAPPPGGLGLAPPLGIGLGLAPAVLEVTTKPVVNPGTKMKLLYWSRILLSAFKNQKTVWEGLHEPQIDTKELETYFARVKGGDGPPGLSSPTAASLANAAAAAVALKSASPGALAKKEKPVLLEAKRFNEISIVLRKMPDLETLIAAIQQMDENVLLPEALDNIRKALPNADEIKLVEDSGLSESQLGGPELFVQGMASIPQVEARVDCWCFKRHFDELYDDLVTPIHAIADACTALRSSTSFRQALSTILAIGNHMNGNTSRGQADGFDLAALSKLEASKDIITGKVSVLEYVCKVAVTKFGDEFGNKLLIELTPLQEAAKFSFKVVSGDIRRFAADVATKKKLSTLVSIATADSIDPFTNIMTTFCTKADAAVHTLIDKLEATHHQMIDTLMFFGMDQQSATRQASDEFFDSIYKFAALSKTYCALYGK